MPNRHKKSIGQAFTLLELLSVCLILTTLAAITTPVILNVVHAARISASMNKLRQLSIAFTQYRSEYEGEGAYGKASAMGLPDYLPFYEGGANLSVSNVKELWEPACGTHPDLRNQSVKYDYAASNLEAEPWASYVQKWQDEAILLRDRNCTEHANPQAADYFQKTVVGVRLNGQALVRKTYGWPMELTIFH